MKKIILSTFFFLFIQHNFAQKASVAAADKQYERYSYIEAIATYERIADKGYKDQQMFQKLGNAYYFNANLEKAAKWYGELFEMNEDQGPEYCYRYSQSLKSIGEYKKADKIIALFNKKSANDQRAILYSNDKNYLEDIKSNSGRFIIEDAGINSEFSDYGTAFSGNNLVFASARDTVGVSKRIFKWTNQSFTNLYSAEVQSNGKISQPVRFSRKVNSIFHESTPVFTKDGTTMYFTRNNYLDGKRGKDTERITLLKIYKATADNGEWKNIVELPFNSDNYSIAHPALSPDDKELYFASNMKGTLGQSDIFKVSINSDGTYSTPINLGRSINTEGRETFPFIAENNELFFASDGRPGLGGLDIYRAKIGIGGVLSFGEVSNLNMPINSAQDDFALMMDSTSKTGFFTSNRPGGHGYDDIYKFTEVPCNQSLSGVVSDLDSNEVIGAAAINLYDKDHKVLGSTISDSNGYYTFAVKCGESYIVEAKKEHYESNEDITIIANKSGESTLPLTLTKDGCHLIVGADLAKCFNIKMIYFDLDKSKIRKDAALELEKILDVLQQYPKVKIDIRSHTDCRQTAKYNEALSDRRAKSTMGWLVNNGIAASRLTAKGYGESQLVNECGCEPTNTSNCTEEQHQLNRRSEFIVTAIE
ncbi:OmpA family protein [Flavobacterium sp. 7A]|uniref:OmpA family protein n=1 Tax=Flavobacterium sp. 7A TaxID=2940571 RepID=UPI0022279CCF|nr:OmpA family protein [Flavobacterium sp. 7A]MCW2121133.1 outer membrane protein OmpA-like peptidoglycan-associated protein/tetratricopeptide (TPR) repeat protein [Flavobacterium sp. 7A]